MNQKTISVTTREMLRIVSKNENKNENKNESKNESIIRKVLSKIVTARREKDCQQFGGSRNQAYLKRLCTPHIKFYRILLL